MDMDGDGVLEHVVAAGESNLGVFIGGWHSIELDADGDGNPEMSREGYAGDSSNNLPALSMTDESNGIRDDFIQIINSQPTSGWIWNIDGQSYNGCKKFWRWIIQLF